MSACEEKLVLITAQASRPVQQHHLQLVKDVMWLAVRFTVIVLL